jgi:hypothetical protein
LAVYRRLIADKSVVAAIITAGLAKTAANLGTTKRRARAVTARVPPRQLQETDGAQDCAREPIWTRCRPRSPLSTFVETTLTDLTKVEVKALAALVNELDRLIGRRGGRPPP